MNEWKPDEAIAAIAKVLLESNLGKEVDLTEEEAMDVADLIFQRLKQGPAL